ncbi:MAG: hypothetical protein Q4D13_05575 [Erysipelotrichaceae bacterium]|nr:hypothetical protein [Erysipelotrichaceae bacterium]
MNTASIIMGISGMCMFIYGFMGMINEPVHKVYMMQQSGFVMILLGFLFGFISLRKENKKSGFILGIIFTVIYVFIHG